MPNETSDQLLIRLSDLLDAALAPTQSRMEEHNKALEGAGKATQELIHGTLRGPLPPVNTPEHSTSADIFKSKDTSFVPAHEKSPREVMRQPLAELRFTIDEETGTRVPITEEKKVRRPKARR